MLYQVASSIEIESTIGKGLNYDWGEGVLIKNAMGGLVKTNGLGH